jgi:hypothetical protein
MTLPTNDDFTNRELSIEELEAIAAGWPGWVHSIAHGVERVAGDVWDALMSPPGRAVSGFLIALAGGIMANQNPIIRNMNRN